MGPPGMESFVGYALMLMTYRRNGSSSIFAPDQSQAMVLGNSS